MPQSAVDERSPTIGNVAEGEVVIISPYERVTEELKRIIQSCEPSTAVGIISELNGVIHVRPGDFDFGENYESLRSVDFEGRDWDYKKEPDFGKYIERQLHEVSDAMARELIAGHNPSLVIDLEQLVGIWGDILGVYNIVGFGDWCSQQGVPRLTLPSKVKDALMKRMRTDAFQGCYTETPYLSGNELKRTEQDLKLVLAGDTQTLSLFQYQP